MSTLMVERPPSIAFAPCFFCPEPATDRCATCDREICLGHRKDLCSLFNHQALCYLQPTPCSGRKTICVRCFLNMLMEGAKRRGKTATDPDLA